MTAESPELPLAAAFPEADRAQWQRLVEGVLRKSGVTEASGAAAEDALATDLQDGIRVRPLYTAEDGGGALGHPGFPRSSGPGAPRAAPSPDGTYASATRTPIRGAPTRRSSPIWRTVSPRSG